MTHAVSAKTTCNNSIYSFNINSLFNIVKIIITLMLCTESVKQIRYFSQRKKQVVLSYIEFPDAYRCRPVYANR